MPLSQDSLKQRLLSLDIVFPTSSIEYPGTRVISHFFNYSTTRVIGSSIEYVYFWQKLPFKSNFWAFLKHF